MMKICFFGGEMFDWQKFCNILHFTRCNITILVYITPFRIALLGYLGPMKAIREKVIDSINPIQAGGKKAHYRFFFLTSTNVRIKPQNLFWLLFLTLLTHFKI